MPSPNPLLRPRTAQLVVILCGLGLPACNTEDPWGSAKPSVRAHGRAEAHEPAPGPRAPDHGFGEAIAWTPLTEGLAIARERNLPLMLVVHASWCRSCQALKPAFHDESLVDLSRQFVMVNVDQDEEPRSQRFQIDGTYVPRVLFIDPSTAQPVPDLRNEARSQSRYYYSPHDDIVEVMHEALARHDPRQRS